MSRLFLTLRERNFMSDLTKELTRDVVGQKIYYYAINENKTNVHDFYNESADGKVYDPPIELPALVGSPDRSVKTDIFGPEYLAKLEAFLHYRDLVDVGMNVCVGDFVRYGEVMYEITNVSKMRNIYGIVEELDGLKLTLTQARRGQIDTPQLGPSDIANSDPGSVQASFEQTRGNEVIKGQPTGDKRTLREEGVLEPAITGPNDVKADERTGADFYADKL